MNITLFSCRSPFLDDSKIYVPLASLYLKSFIESKLPNINVRLADDDYNLEDSSFFENSDMMGVSIMTPQKVEALKLLQAIKKYSKIPVVAGGPHCKYYLSDMKDEPWDFIVPLDGERALVNILLGIAKDRIVVDVMNKKDIAVAPRPDRTSEEAIKLLNRYSYSLNGRRATTMMTARGCPEKCHFCEDAMSGVKWSSLENIIGELDDIKRLGFEGVYIFDDLFAIAQKMVKPICDELKKRDLVYRCNGQARYFTRDGDEFAKMLSDTGCVEIAFGFESGSQKILDIVEKRTTVKQNYESVEYAKKHGIRVKGFLMLGLPGEDERTIEETRKFIESSGMDDFQLAVYMPFKGTQIRDAIDRGEDIGLSMTVNEASGAYGIKGGETAYEVRTTAFSSDDLKRIRNELVEMYKPKSHVEKWKDKFHDTTLGG